MSETNFSRERKDFSFKSVLTAVVEIMNYNYFLELDKFHELQLFYEELVDEIFNMRQQNFSYGFEMVQPEITILSDRIYLYTNLYLEDDVPELNTMVFKLFVETLNLLLAVGLKHDLAIRGFAGPDTGIKSITPSGVAVRPVKKDNLVLTDMLKVFRFDQIFPEEGDQKIATTFISSSLHSTRFHQASNLLKEINAIGIYFPEEIRNCPYAEVSIYSDMLIETKLQDNMRYVANWLNWAQKHPDKFPVEDVRGTIIECGKGSEKHHASSWKRFGEIG